MSRWFEVLLILWAAKQWYMKPWGYRASGLTEKNVFHSLFDKATRWRVRRKQITAEAIIWEKIFWKSLEWNTIPYFLKLVAMFFYKVSIFHFLLPFWSHAIHCESCTFLYHAALLSSINCPLVPDRAPLPAVYRRNCQRKRNLELESAARCSSPYRFTKESFRRELRWSGGLTSKATLV